MKNQQKIYIYYLPTAITKILRQRGQIFSMKNALIENIRRLQVNASTHKSDKEYIASKAIEERKYKFASLKIGAIKDCILFNMFHVINYLASYILPSN